jgi:tetratricopeptide (TPR) repeat protein
MSMTMDDKKTNLAPLLLRARNMASQGKTQDAIGIYTDVIQIEPTNATAYADRGTVRAMIEDFVLARSDLERAFGLGYREASAFSTAGTVCLQLKDYPKSLEYFDKAIQLDPKYPFSYYNRSKAHHEMGDNAAAIADLEKCLAMQPDADFKKLLEARVTMLKSLS